MSTTTRNLGRVSIVPKGEWNSGNTYIRLDLVNYNGSSYIAKQDVPVNINLNNSNYWLLIAAKGEKGDTGLKGNDGNGISSIIMNNDYTLTINFTNGTSFTT